MTTASPNPYTPFRLRLGRIACILILTLILLPPTPISRALTEPILIPPRGHYGETVFVEGRQGDVGGGLTAVTYWDTVKPWDGTKGLLNASTAQPSGYYNTTFKVPEAPGGVYKVIVKEQESSLYTFSSFKVVPFINLRDHIYYGESLTVEGYGFGRFAGVTFLLMEYVSPSGIDWWPSLEINSEIIDRGDGDKRTFDFEAVKKPVKPGSTTLSDGHETFTDSGNGVLIGSGGGSGVIDYTTGKGKVTFSSAPAQAANIEAGYRHYSGVPSIQKINNLPLEASGLGTLSGGIKMPALPHGEYLICAIDSVNNTWIKRIHLGPEIEINIEEVDVGDVLRIKGRGFTAGDLIASDDVRLFSDDWAGENCQLLQESAIVDSSGYVSFDVFIPQVPKANEEYWLEINDQHQVSNNVHLFVKKQATVSATVERFEGYYKVHVTGTEFPNKLNENVMITLQSRINPSETYNIAETTTNAYGNIDTRFIVSTNSYQTYTMIATAEQAKIEAETLIQITPLNVELSKYMGLPGDEVTVTGTGFTPQKNWEASFSNYFVVSSAAGVVTSRGTLKLVNSMAKFKVPDMLPGTYTITFTDVESTNKFEVEFQVDELVVKIEGKPPTPVITSPDTVHEGDLIHFSSAGSGDPDGVITEFTWDFGDDSGSSLANPTHTYRAQGIYPVKLTVKDNSGLTAAVLQTVTVMDTEPVPDFLAINTQGIVPLKVHFSETCLSFDGLYTWMWDFGDGQSSLDKNPVHTYLVPGLYTVRLTVYESDGDSKAVIKEDLVQVYDFDNLPPVIHVTSAEKIDKNAYMFTAVATDNQKIMSVKVKSSSAEQRLELDPLNLGVYKSMITGLDPAQCTVVAEDIGGNVYQTYIQNIIKNNVISVLSPGWNVVQIPNSYGRIPIDSTSVNGLALEPLLIARGLNNIIDNLPLPRIETIWTYDPYLGYLVTSDTVIVEFNYFEPGRVYWIKLSEDYPYESILCFIV